MSSAQIETDTSAASEWEAWSSNPRPVGRRLLRPEAANFPLKLNHWAGNDLRTLIRQVAARCWRRNPYCSGLQLNRQMGQSIGAGAPATDSEPWKEVRSGSLDGFGFANTDEEMKGTTLRLAMNDAIAGSTDSSKIALPLLTLAGFVGGLWAGWAVARRAGTSSSRRMPEGNDVE